jgi:hypothetical protein
LWKIRSCCWDSSRSPISSGEVVHAGKLKCCTKRPEGAIRILCSLIDQENEPSRPNPEWLIH